MRITIADTGYVGLTTAVLLAYIGYDVTGVDIDERKLKLLKEGKKSDSRSRRRTASSIIKQSPSFYT